MQLGYVKIAIFDQCLVSLRVVNAATIRCYQHGATGLWQLGDSHRWYW